MLTVQQIFEIGLKLGVNSDPRGKKFVAAELERNKRQYAKLSAEEKSYFDTEYLTNPYSDSRILYSPSPKHPVKKLFAGIDADDSELLLADRLGDVDLVITHHPEGIALADLPEVMKVQVEIMHLAGVPIHVAENLLASRIAEVNRGVLPINDHKAVDIARLLNVPYMATHTFTDNLAAQFMDNLMAANRKKIFYVGDILETLLTVPEYQQAKRLKSGPTIYVGSANRIAGRIAATEFTGGTSGAKDMFEQLSRAGVGTVIGMHMREEHRKVAEQHHMNVVIAGHISSDSIGMNLFLDEIEKRGVEVVPVGGLLRVKRFKENASNNNSKRNKKR